MFNESNEIESPIIGSRSDDKEPTSSSTVKMDIRNDDEPWIEVPKKYRRYQTNIPGLHVQGDAPLIKLKNLTNRLALEKGFIECRKYIFKKELWIKAIFETKEDALSACNLQLFDGNEHKLNLIANRGDEDTLRRSLVIRDLPLDTDKDLLKAIIEDKFGTIELITLRLSGPWFRADVILKEDNKIEENLDTWAIQYKKELVRIAPAYYTREQIEERNQYTLKLTNLLYGTTPIDLKPVIEEFKCKTCFIPRTRNRYTRQRYAYVSFKDEEDLEKATRAAEFKFGDDTLLWDSPESKTCHKCGSNSHLVAECEERVFAEQNKERKKQYSTIYTRYKVPNYKKITNNSNITKQRNETTNQESQLNANSKGVDVITLIKNMQNQMEKNFEIINKELQVVKDKIKKLEETVEQTPSKQPNTQKSIIKGIYNSTFNKYLPTVKEANNFRKQIETENIKKNENLNKEIGVETSQVTGKEENVNNSAKFSFNLNDKKR
jgi:RNA recognition motif. (a.k.a. RRM, RBD, or RNP domain)